MATMMRQAKAEPTTTPTVTYSNTSDGKKRSERPAAMKPSTVATVPFHIVLLSRREATSRDYFVHSSVR